MNTAIGCDCGDGPSGEGRFEGGGRHLVEAEPEDLTMGAVALEGPGEVGLHGDADRATGCDDAEEDAGAVRALVAMLCARKQRVRGKIARSSRCGPHVNVGARSEIGTGHCASREQRPPS